MNRKSIRRLISRKIFLILPNKYLKCTTTTSPLVNSLQLRVKKVDRQEDNLLEPCQMVDLRIYKLFKTSISFK